MGDKTPYRGIKETFEPTFLEAKAGDIIITHDFLPHSANANRTPGFVKVITNPHVCLTQPLQLARDDGNYVSIPKSQY
jgi:ectoine hydroxylase-related dioxygenase (phytanoyl-CoA dioxygenase family)